MYSCSTCRVGEEGGWQESGGAGSPRWQWSSWGSRAAVWRHLRAWRAPAPAHIRVGLQRDPVLGHGCWLAVWGSSKGRVQQRRWTAASAAVAAPRRRGCWQRCCASRTCMHRYRDAYMYAAPHLLKARGQRESQANASREQQGRRSTAQERRPGCRIACENGRQPPCAALMSWRRSTSATGAAASRLLELHEGHLQSYIGDRGTG